MIDCFDVTLSALTGDEPRRAWVYVPDLARRERSRRFPVLYMFDGHNLFYDDVATYGKSWGLKEFLEEREVPLIVAAAECNHAGIERLHEYSPYSGAMPGQGSIKGRGKAMMDWYVDDFKPYVDAHYPTLPDREHTFLAGSSMGGLMTLYGVLRYNKTFSRGAALSPTIWYARDKLESMIRSARVSPGTALYMDYGRRELENRAMAEHFCAVAGAVAAKGVDVTSRIVPGGTHSEASWERQLPFVMETLFYELEEV